jgi:hypothetical protein
MRLFISIYLLFVLVSCKKFNQISDCIDSKVKEFKTSVNFQGASVQEYNFQGQFVYVFDDGSSVVDGMAAVYDGNCEYLGGLGGFTGNSKINGVNFYSNAKYRRTIWHN